MSRFSWVVLCFLATFHPLNSVARAGTWEKAIEAVEKKEKVYAERAIALGFTGYLGTAYNEIMVAEHECAILGRMLNRVELITHLEKETLPENPTGEELMAESQSMANWTHTARRLLQESIGKRVEIWNLNCVGHLGISEKAFISTSSPTTFYEIDKDGTVLRVLGDVERGFAEKLVDALDRNPSIRTVALGSGGGFVNEALQAGREIRRRNLATTLWENCYSACTLVFMAGTTRTVWSPYRSLGFHQISLDGEAIPFDDPTYHRVARYMSAMGVNSKIGVSLMQSASPREFKYVDPKKLCDGNIATWVQRLCAN